MPIRPGGRGRADRAGGHPFALRRHRRGGASAITECGSECRRVIGCRSLIDDTRRCAHSRIMRNAEGSKYVGTARAVVAPGHRRIGRGVSSGGTGSHGDHVVCSHVRRRHGVRLQALRPLPRGARSTRKSRAAARRSAAPSGKSIQRRSAKRESHEGGVACSQREQSMTASPRHLPGER